MDRANSEILLEAIKRVRDDPNGFLEICDPDLRWEVGAAGMWPDGAVYEGHEGITRFWSDWVENWDDYRFEQADAVDVGDTVVTEQRHQARGKASGVEVDWRFGGIWTFRDGKLIRHEAFPSRAKALQEAKRREALSPDD